MSRMPHTAGVLPSSLLVWHPTELPEGFGIDEEISLASSTSTAKAGDRGLVYRTTRDQGIVGIFDLLSDAHRHPDMRWAAYGILRRIDPFVPRADLMRDEILRPLFSTMRGRKNIPEDLRLRLLSRLPQLPLLATTHHEPIPSPDEHWEWIPSRPETDWGSEAAMRNAIASDRRAWKKLGFTSAPTTEVRPPHSTLRMDLYGPGIIGECKNVLSGLETLRQLDGYLGLCASGSSGPWRGHLIVSAGFTTELARAVSARKDVKLWTCRRALGNRPDLTEIKSR